MYVKSVCVRKYFSFDVFLLVRKVKVIITFGEETGDHICKSNKTQSSIKTIKVVTCTVSDMRTFDDLLTLTVKGLI